MLAKCIDRWLSLLAIVILTGSLLFNTQAKVVDRAEVQANIAKDVSTTEFLQALMLEKGIGSFIQSKYFKFLSVPIRSTGHFIVKQQAVLWQTISPVFSEVLIQESGVYQRLGPKDKYQLFVDNAEFSSLLLTLFTGQINPMQWQVGDNVRLIDGVKLAEATNLNTDMYCLVLQPKVKQLQQLFQRVDLCLSALQPKVAPPKGLVHFDLSKRYISLFDQQGNKTQISMQIKAIKLTVKQAQALTLNPNVSNANDNNQASVNAH